MRQTLFAVPVTGSRLVDLLKETGKAQKGRKLENFSFPDWQKSIEWKRPSRKNCTRGGAHLMISLLIDNFPDPTQNYRL